MKKILVTTDFSTHSKTGIRFAIQLATQAPCELIFYHANAKTPINAWTDDNYNDLKDTENAMLKNKLWKFVMAIYKQAGHSAGKVDWMIDNGTEVDTAIIEYAQKIHADFICMGTRGGGTISKLLGTNASKLMTSSPVPVMVVPYTYRTKLMENILYASDMQNIGIELRAVLQFAGPFKAKIGVYHYDYLLDYAEEKSKLNQVAIRHHFENVVFNFRKLNAERSLLAHLQTDIKKSNPSLIVMFTKQDRNWFERLFLSSKTAALGFDTKTPMLVFRK
ncbi:MAG: hypothetical protein CFE23_12650 [Flavobacterium sp. BFFFF1]|uniref:universal stress protein n=1 Tax=Flavobacterium sp. BFFFF1 TaxID=2015557 RepID=UPI000BCB0AFA|nr:universal stress protein [Flavobacterium sp. BFFFF1]OYU79748.1 MAG: hypothetical protein CFE23_12650 [Flavobacterium sp. BFFFF1]